MFARLIASQLREAGFPIRSYTEGGQSGDGEVELTDRISVQLPKGNVGCLIVAEISHGEFKFYPFRRTAAELKVDYQHAAELIAETERINEQLKKNLRTVVQSMAAKESKTDAVVLKRAQQELLRAMDKALSDAEDQLVSTYVTEAMEKEIARVREFFKASN